MMSLLLPISVPINEFISIRRGNGHWVKTEADAEGSVSVPLGAEWNRAHGCWTYFEADHDENEECPVCASEEPCVQEVSVYPSGGKIHGVHEPMVAMAVSGKMPATN